MTLIDPTLIAFLHDFHRAQNTRGHWPFRRPPPTPGSLLADALKRAEMLKEQE